MSLVAQKITKLDAANRQIHVAIQMSFDGGDPVAVHTLACAAREICEKHCRMAGVSRFFDQIAKTYPDNSETEIFCVLNSARNFFKHPDAAGNLDAEIELSDRDNKLMLFLATYDCSALLAERTPVDVQAYNVWFMATEPDFDGDCAQGLEEHYPGIASASPDAQRAIGKQLLSDAVAGKL